MSWNLAMRVSFESRWIFNQFWHVIMSHMMSHSVKIIVSPKLGQGGGSTMLSKQATQRARRRPYTVKHNKQYCYQLRLIHRRNELAKNPLFLYLFSFIYSQPLGIFIHLTPTHPEYSYIITWFQFCHSAVNSSIHEVMTDIHSWEGERRWPFRGSKSRDKQLFKEMVQ